jgi:HSP20 family protein
MNLLKYEPMKELETMAQRIQKYFEDFPSTGLELSNSFSPRIDISEDEKHLIIEAEIPGMKKEDIKITLQDNILTIKGEKKKEEEKKEKNFYRSERIFGSFSRSFTLPVEVNSDKVEAKYENGALIIKMEKVTAKPANQKTIELK